MTSDRKKKGCIITFLTGDDAITYSLTLLPIVYSLTRIFTSGWLVFQVPNDR